MINYLIDDLDGMPLKGSTKEAFLLNEAERDLIVEALVYYKEFYIG